MRKTLVVSVVALLTLALAAAVLARQSALTVSLEVAPKNLLLGWSQCSVTAHAVIKYADVNPDSVKLNGVAASAVFADNRGELVGKFNESAIKALVSPPSADLTLTGLTTSGEAFSGTATVAVRIK